MEYNEVYKNLFKVDSSYHLAQCISSCAKMGAGIALEFRANFDMSPIDNLASQGKLKVGSCVKMDRIFNLITKEKFYNKPTKDSFKRAVYNMKNSAVKNGVKKIAMPQIGAGLDRLDWNENREVIKECFKDTDIEILVCIKNK